MGKRTAFASIAIALAVALALVACGVELPTVSHAVPGETSAPDPTPTPVPSGDTHRAAVSFGESTPINDADLLSVARNDRPWN